MNDTRKKLIELVVQKQDCGLTHNPKGQDFVTYNAELVDHLIAHGVTIQKNDIEKLSIGLGRLSVMMIGHDKKFSERMDGYDPSAFCVGFEYAIQLAKGLLTQLQE